MVPFHDAPSEPPGPSSPRGLVCPCGSGAAYDDCCAPRHDGRRPAETPEALMRSRYAAFAVADGRYLVATRVAGAGADENAEELSRWARSVTWLGLSVREAAGGTSPDEGFVAFTARYLEGDLLVSLSERSRFVRRDGRWLYVDGAPEVSRAKVGRNEPCPCGSGRKFKQCHA